jgi:hypothetical protein
MFAHCVCADGEAQAGPIITWTWSYANGSTFHVPYQETGGWGRGDDIVLHDSRF